MTSFLQEKPGSIVAISFDHFPADTYDAMRWAPLTALISGVRHFDFLPGLIGIE
jgi:hypothetical protein